MAIRLIDRYPTRANPANADYPHGSGRNKTAPTAIDGTPFDEARYNDHEALFQAIIEAAEVTPNNTVDTVPASQYADALSVVANGLITIDVAGDQDAILDYNQARVHGFRLTGALAGNIDVIVPDTERMYTVVNDTTGDFSVTVRTGLGSGLAAPQGEASLFRCNGTNVVHGYRRVNKVEIAGLCPERVSDTILRIFPGYCADGSASPSEIMELLIAYDIDVTTTGLGGIDTGVYAADTDYFVYILKNPDTGDVGAVISTEIATSLVTKPAGYSLIRKLPWGFVSIGGGIPTIHISHWPLPETRYTDADTTSTWAVLANGTSETYTTFDLSGLIPDNARMAHLLVRVDRIAAAGSAFIRATSGSAGLPCGYVPDIVGFSSFNYMSIRTTSARALSYKVDAGTRLSVYVLGYSQTERS